MDYFKAFETIKGSLEKSEISLKDEHLAIQVILTDEDCGGILYIENYFKKLVVMPYDYYDNNVNVISDYKSFIELITAKKNLGALLDKIKIKGDFEAAKEFFDSIKPKKAAAKKTTTRKTAVKKAEPKKVSEKKTETKKTTAKKAAEDKPAAKKEDAVKKTVKKATKKESEKAKMTAKTSDAAKEKSTIEKVVEKETKPAKKETKK